MLNVTGGRRRGTLPRAGRRAVQRGAGLGAACGAQVADGAAQPLGDAAQRGCLRRPARALRRPARRPLGRR